MKKKDWILLISILILGIILVIVFSSTGNRSNTQSKTTSSQDNNSIDTTKEYMVGETYQNNSLAIKFVSLDDNFKGYNQYADVKSGYKVIKAEFEFENIGKSDVLASAYDFDCYADSYDCESFWSADGSGFSSSLSSGKKTRGCVYFQVPENATSITLEYELNMWTNSKAIFKVK